MNKQVLIRELKGTAPVMRLIVDRQTAEDILRQIVEKHKECRADYDLIAEYFDGGTTREVCRRIWEFCKDNFSYVEEDEEKQFTSCPYTMLTGGAVDCKNYALFAAGILDALCRRGRSLRWQFRFVSYSLLDPTPGHVFVVVNATTDNIWIDPVLTQFDYHLFYWYARNRVPRYAAVGKVGCVACGCGSATIGTTQAENSLLAEVLAYQQGLRGAIDQTYSTNAFNQISSAVLQAVAVAAIPGAAQALAFLKAGAVEMDLAFGVGSEGARVITDLSNLNIVGLWNDLQGRTYNTDQYWAAVYYKFYVLGQNVTDITRVADSDVLPALKWFIDRTGVFISGREHIIALTQSSTAYMNYYGVNHDTTTDTTMVNAAHLVAAQYWPQPGNFNAMYLGAWKNTVGVYDNGLVQFANSLGMTPEQYTAATGTQDKTAQSYIDQTKAATSAAAEILPGVPNIALVGAAAALLYFIVK